MEKKCFKLINKTITNFSSLHQFYKGNLNKFVLLLKNAYRYQYMDSWERFDGTSLPDEKTFYSNLCAYSKSMGCIWNKKPVNLKPETYGISWLVCFKRYLIACWCVWKLCKKMYWNICTWSCSFFLPAPGLVWQAYLKKCGEE